MTLTGFPFVLDPADKHRLLTLEEHEGLCCLLDRARHYGGAGDIAFLCMSTCSLLVRFAPEKTGTWTVCGYAFQKAQEPWVWAYLPSLPGTLLAPPSGKLLFHAERADTADVWLERHDPSLSHGARQLARDTARQMHPHSVGFTHLDPAVYADDGIHWYALEPSKSAEEHTILLPQPPAREPEPADSMPADEIRIVPPRITKTWRVVRGEEKYKLGAVDETSDWYVFADRMRSAMTNT